MYHVTLKDNVTVSYDGEDGCPPRNVFYNAGAWFRAHSIQYLSCGKILLRSPDACRTLPPGTQIDIRQEQELIADKQDVYVTLRTRNGYRVPCTFGTDGFVGVLDPNETYRVRCYSPIGDEYTFRLSNDSILHIKNKDMVGFCVSRVEDTFYELKTPLDLGV
jgi:hypothetical protein